SLTFSCSSLFYINDPATTATYTPSLHDALPISGANIGRWRCTMAQALSHALPAKLAALGQVLHLPPELLKDEGGHLVQLFCKPLDRKSTRLNSSHVKISYAVFCLKKKTKIYV